MPPPTARPYPERFKVAFSLAGEQRELVQSIAVEVERLLGLGTVFYDEWYESVIAGFDGDLELQKIYHAKTDLVMVCISANYDSKPWTKIEWEAIRALQAVLRVSDDLGDRLRVLPIRVGDGEVQGFYLTSIYIEARSRTPRQTELIADRYQQWRQSDQAVAFEPKGAALLLPVVASLAGVVEDIESGSRMSRLPLFGSTRNGRATIAPSAFSTPSRRRM